MSNQDFGVLNHYQTWSANCIENHAEEDAAQLCVTMTVHDYVGLLIQITFLPHVQGRRWIGRRTSQRSPHTPSNPTESVQV